MDVRKHFQKASGGGYMDRITESLLAEFAKEHELIGLPQEKQFEHFAGFITVRRQHSETFDTYDIVTGNGGDAGIDAVAIIVNGSLITDVESFEELAEGTPSLDVSFIFVQAERGSSFETAKIGQFQFGVMDFFKEKPSLPQNAAIKDAAKIMSAIYKQSSKFKRGNPFCRLFYVTTGRWKDDANLEARRKTAISDLVSTGLFSDVEFLCIGADNIQKLYNQTKNAIAREFIFADRAVIPVIAGVSEAYLGYIPALEFISIVSEEGEIIKSIFYDNVRDWQNYNPVNSEIKETLESDNKSRFVLMNNGVTIIARTLRATGNKFFIEDFQIVNGCQTSHVLIDQRNNLDASVMIPLRLIGTQDEDIIQAVIHATNRQTEIKSEQFFAITEFSKKLEAYFQTFPNGKKLFYERRTHQYDSMQIEKKRIVTPENLIRAFAAMFLSEPHRTTRNFGALKAKLGKEIFAKEHRLEPYYVSAFALFKLEQLFRSFKIDAKYKPARFQILLALRMLANPAHPPLMNSHEMERYCTKITDVLWDAGKLNKLIEQAVKMVESAAKGNFDRDNIRTQSFTEKVSALVAAFFKAK